LTQTDSTSPIDVCLSARCAFHCRGPCGWDSPTGSCIAGGVTVDAEQFQGACGSLTAAPTSVGVLTVNTTALESDSTASTTNFSLYISVVVGIVVLLTVVMVGIMVCRRRTHQNRRNSSWEVSKTVETPFSSVEILTTRTSAGSPLPRLNFGPLTPYHGTLGDPTEKEIAESSL
jgi:hypothetical protein